MAPIHKSLLSDLDWKVVEMARVDGPQSLKPDSFRARFFRDFLGVHVALGLANDGLEALRRFCVRAWYWDFIPPQDVHPLIDAGYSSDDVRRILDHVASRRGFTPSLLGGPA